MDKEMQRALEADGEKLQQLTGEDHGPWPVWDGRGIMIETVSTKTQCLIEHLLHVHALANMARASENTEYLRSAAGWLPQIESTVKSIREELEALSLSLTSQPDQQKP